MSPRPGSRRALVFGEVLIDEYPDKRVVAGAPLHVAAHLAALGWSAAVVSRVGDDDDGRRIRSVLDDYGIDAGLLERDENLPTGTVHIDLHGDGSHTFAIRRPVAWDAIRGPEDPPSAEVLYFGTLALRDERSRSALRRLESRSSDSMRVVDINLRPPDYDTTTVRFVMEHADVVKLNEEEVPEVARLLGARNDTMALFESGSKWVCVTKGSSGAELYHRDGGSWSRRGSELDVVDTVGAGDAFCAGLIDGLARELEPDQVLAQAQSRAAAIVERRGGLPDPP